MTPMIYRWSGEAMEPLARFHNAANAEFVVGETYTLVEQHERSQASHNHFFAALNDAWLNLPEGEAERFPTAEHLRKWALVRAGWRNEITIACASKAEAARKISDLKSLDDYAVVIARENLLIVYTAKSQSVKAMGKADFQKSKDDVLGVVADLIGVAPEQLGKAA